MTPNFLFRVLIASDHSDVDYHELVKSSHLEEDTGNATRAINTDYIENSD